MKNVKKIMLLVATVWILSGLTLPLLSQAPSDDDMRSPGFFESLVSAKKRTLFVKTEVYRYINELGQTDFEIVYKIPNNELQFIQTEVGLVATLYVKFDILRDDIVLRSNHFEHLAGAQTIGIAQSENHFVLDKLFVTLTRDDFTAHLEIQDKNASTTFETDYILDLLPLETVISDIEVSHGISTNITTALENFQRGQYQFYVDPIPVIDSNEKDFIIYYQVSNITPRPDSLFTFFEFVKVLKEDEVLYETEFSHTVEFLPYPLVRRIPIGNWDAGLYTIDITIKDPEGNKTAHNERYFSLNRKYNILSQRVFADDEEEFELISYFLDNRQRRLWRDLNEEGRKNFIERFWVANNPNPITQENLFLESTRTRVNEANWRFSYHRAGWKTDLGRIYIKYGSPDNIDREETPHEGRYPRKPYQVWKYDGTDKTYVFLDFQGNGNYRLIYVKNDDTENGDPGWKGYFGEDFSESNFN